ncbi:MAG: protein-glutamate O-methyltransferase CheR [Sphingobacteriia bacterium]|nr:MAG: protein-glutamate O-methyltransferase CheR [Sphingobacteriia bacterium]
MQVLEQQDLLELIYHKYGYDFINYAKPSLYRRIDKFIADNQLESINNFHRLLMYHPEIFQLFLKDVTVNVTELFRDPLYYKYLREIIIPRLASYPIINIWHAGCSTGEEVFSLCILLKEAGLLKRARIYATDINANNLEKAKQGIIPLRTMKDYTMNYLQSGGTEDFSEYYTAKYDMAIINESIRSSIIFSQHNLVSDHPFNEFQLIMCRNVMIYFNRVLQERVLNLLHDSLAPLGYLGIGLKETLAFSEVQPKFETISKNLKLYKRIA